MKIILTRLVLLNFKGVREQVVSFDEKQTTISGANATGKTTIFDAFTWLLFGKDSQDRKDFDIKTFDDSGSTIERIPHEVAGGLLVDGRELSLKRCYCEKWTRKRGSDTEEFTGHETKYYVNGVDKSQGEYNAVIADLCSEQLFKLITNPLFFPAQKKEAQRAMLFELAGNIADNDIISQRQEFVELFAELSGKSLDDFKKEIVAKKKKLKETLEAAPIQLGEVERNLPEVQDWAAIEGAIAAKKRDIVAIDDQLSDQAKWVEAEQKKRAEIQRQIGEKKVQRTALEFSLSEAATKEYNEKRAQRSEVEANARQLRSDEARLKQEAQQLIEREATQKNRIAEYRAQWQEENEQKIGFVNETSPIICPTCKRQFSADDIEVRQEEIRKNFNAKKAARLEEIQKAAAVFKKGLEEIHEAVRKNEAELEHVTAELGKAEGNPILLEQLTAPEAPDLENNAEYVALTNAIAQLEERSNVMVVPDITALKSEKQQLQAEVDALNRQSALKFEVERGQKRIAELKEQIRANAQEMATLEKQEFTIAAFSKAKVEAIEGRINGMFELVKFKMFETQINGQEVETCEATVGGVPYSSLNHAMTINAGLDIINTISRKNNVFAPIFIDNAEAVNTLLPTNAQMVRLVVNNDKKLTVTI